MDANNTLTGILFWPNYLTASRRFVIVAVCGS